MAGSPKSYGTFRLYDFRLIDGQRQCFVSSQKAFRDDDRMVWNQRANLER